MALTETGAAKLTARFEEALVYATRLHAQQTRKGSDIPYAAHLLSVTALVLEDGGDEDEAIAALLHDAVEDQGGRATLEEIRRRFGERVASIVEACSDADTIPKPPWRTRKERYLDHLRQAAADVRRVSAADKLHNARAILADLRRLGDALWDRFNGGKAGTLWYYRTLVQVYREGQCSEVESGPLVEELDRVVSEIERLAAGDS